MTSPPRLRLVEETGPEPPRDTSTDSGDIQGALLDILGSDDELRDRFEGPCRKSAAALREEVLTFRVALKEWGHRYRYHDREHEKTAGALYELAGELMPDSPGAALARLRERVGIVENPGTLGRRWRTWPPRSTRSTTSW